ncbi:HlyD family type I secretion periplasmic adaptor subunit [Devosia sp. WQ 349]|uniref:HlyD family type I secretion periplasmic adaptor subunit n=1 Tax=Devosia sp. WQ 349K1 TaxID=2800329 RepID=UPI0019078167|nr:HlyD family type I secretion periplasmic adaptor subunit [Devosia sp. WQ 349K1]MBK1796294.1 HlyD family type I secretion periplasmic adaptor subunit [Devosia sp. WQ 349K1]
MKSAKDSRAPRRHLGAEFDRPPRGWSQIVFLIACIFVAFLFWANWAEVDQISRAEGKVIPSGKSQIVQSAEPGVVTDIFVRSGEQVSSGQLLVRLDDTTTAASAGEVAAKVLALSAQAERLRVESLGLVAGAFICPDRVTLEAPGVCAAELDLLTSRLQSKLSTAEVLQQRVEQRQRELNEIAINKTRLEANLAISEERLALVAPLAERGLSARTDLLALRSEVGDLSGQIAAVDEGKARLAAALLEAQLQVKQADEQFRQEALSELTLRRAELASAEQQLRGAADRVNRTEVRSPVDGIVNAIDVTTIGAVVTAGTRLMDIVPKSDFLLVEARLKPSDVAFVIPGQQARIQFTAYDFSVYGGLSGIVDNVSADSLVDEQTRETYYLVTVRAEETVLHYREQQLATLPGMVTTVDIITGKHSILQYLLKPINKARQEALIER